MTDVNVKVLGRAPNGYLKVRFNAGEATVPGWPEAEAALEDVDWEMGVFDPFLLENNVHDGMKEMVLKFGDADELDKAKNAVRDHAQSLYGKSKDAGQVEEFADLIPSSSEVREEVEA